jgi:malate/lactate dehydrogenase
VLFRSLGACLSGAGSTIIAFADALSTLTRIEGAFRAAAADLDLPGRVAGTKYRGEFEERMKRVTDEIRKAGGEIVALLKTGSAYFSPGTATVAMAESILNDQKRIMAASVWCEKEYGIGGYFMGVPAILGAQGVEKVVEIELVAEEKAAFQKSLDSVKKTVQEMKGKGF